MIVVVVNQIDKLQTLDTKLVERIVIVNVGQEDYNRKKQLVKEFARTHMTEFSNIIVFPPPPTINTCILMGIGYLFGTEVKILDDTIEARGCTFGCTEGCSTNQDT